MVRDLGVFVCRSCGPGQGEVDLSQDALSFLRFAATQPAMDMNRVVWTPDSARQLAMVHRELIAAHLERELRSTRVLHQVEGVPVAGKDTGSNS